MNRILIIDDEIAICDSLEFALQDDYHVTSFNEPFAGLKYLAENPTDVLLLDLKIKKVDGLKILKQAKEIQDDIQVIMMTAFGSIDSSVKAIKEGAYHYLIKPLDVEELLVYVEKAIDYKNMSGSLNNLKQIVENKYSFQGIVGKSKALNEILEKVYKVKDIDSTVLITGESGTGKDLIAKALHFQGKRKNNRFEIVNCAAIPDNLLESELFGHEKGAFTGADKKRLGKIEAADKGTIFLDEIGEMDLQLQAKILRVVEDRQVVPVGSEKGKKVDVRIIAATNKDLEDATKRGVFREDLFYRLNVITLKMPPLRERKEDIPALVNRFVDQHNKKLGKMIKGFTSKAMEAIENYSFPGNIRELENLVERLVAFSESDYINLNDLPEAFNTVSTNHLQVNDEDCLVIPIGLTMKEIEKQAIELSLKYFNGNRGKAADSLGISKRSMQYKIKEYDI